MNILGVKIDEVDIKKALSTIAGYLNSSKQQRIFTPNPEMLVDAQKDIYFREVLNSGNLNICDGRGIELVSRGKLIRYPGVELMLDICKLAAKKSRSIYLLGSGSDKVIEDAANKLKNKYSNLKIVGLDKGPVIKKMSNKINNELIEKIKETNPDILFVAFGHGKQEKWIYENLYKLPSVKIAVGVGGAFDYVAGRVRRAPKWMRKIGLEWFYRLLRQPWRVKRIYKATIKFLYLYATK